MIFLQLFYTFFKIGLFSFGGGYGMLSVIQGEAGHRVLIKSKTEKSGSFGTWHQHLREPILFPFRFPRRESS